MAHDLASLITVLEQDRVLDDHKKAVLLEKVTSLKKLLEESVLLQHRHLRDKIIDTLQNEIRDAAHEAEDLIESHQMLSMSKLMQKFDAANDKLKHYYYHHESRRDEGVATSLDPSSSKTNTAVMVGFDEDALQLKERLISHRSVLEIIPIVGMGGMGKTTLARNLYNDPLIVSHFDARAWVTVSRDYNMRAILLGLLGSISRILSEDILRQNDNELGYTLYRSLLHRRYLVVLDDVWSEGAWNQIQRCFPKQENGSRILLTSRELHVAKHPDSGSKEHQMHLLSDAQGWDLLRHTVFEKYEHCPPFLEEIGRKIASDCGGLPLAISVVGGLLSVDKYSKNLWDEVARDARSIAGSHISEIQRLSYDNLPLHLKPCFLYMSAFPEDFEVRHSKLVKLLAAEGFLWRPNEKNNKSMEDMAEEYLKDLADRNLLSVTRTKYNGRAKRYIMHSILRDFCVRKAKEEKFLCSVECANAYNFRRLSVGHKDAPEVAEEDLSCSRSLLFINPISRWISISSTLSSLRLVRVLDVYDIHFKYFPVDILKLANLRFLAVKFSGSLPAAIWRLRNLQTLWLWISGYFPVILSREAWEISSLRHIILKNNKVDIDFKVPRVHENLQTISDVSLHDLLGSDLINNIPNIRKLGISAYGFVSGDGIIDLSHLYKLETLKLENFCVDVLSRLKLPRCLKKLSLIWCTLPMGLVNGLDDLPDLEVLKIHSCKFESEERSEGDEWVLDGGVELRSLKLLSLQYLTIKRWITDYSQFPMLRHLRIQNCADLKEIPTGFEGSFVETIEVDKCAPAQLAWANEVRDLQRDEYGIENLQIRSADYY